MAILRESGQMLGNTVLVTAAVILGFTIGSAIGMPVWLQPFCLIPAGLLFCRLSGHARPSWTKAMVFLSLLSALTFVFAVIFPLVPHAYQTLAFVFFAVFTPVTPITVWLQKRFAKATPSNHDVSAK